MSTEPASIAIPADEHVRSMHRHRFRTRFLMAFLLGLMAVLAVGVGALYAYDQQYRDRILPGIHVGTTDVSGLTADEAAARLHAAYDRLAEGNVVLAIGGRTVQIPYGYAARGPDVEAMVDEAMSLGRAGSPVERVIASARTAVRGVTVEPIVAFDADRLAAEVAWIAANQHVAPADAVITKTDDGFVVANGVPGQEADPAAAIGTLTEALGQVDAPSTLSVDVPLTPIPPTFTTEEAQAAVDAANRIAADLRVVDAKHSFTISAHRIRSLISFQPDADGSITPFVDESGFDPIVRLLAQKINLAAHDAGLRLINGHVVASGTSREGRTLNAASTKAAIIGEIRARQAGAAASPIAAVVKAVDPKLTTAAARSFAGKMRPISSFSVYYFVIVNNHWGGNIEAPATKINGTVVPAGTVFDFWKVVGDLHKLPGEGPGNAIEGGKITVTGAFGGGICTTSTTLFNAAFRAGMVPLARQNHNEFINRYPPGLDATVWIVGGAKQTMSFMNDTKYPILITRTITNAGSRRWLTFKIWSVPNGRTATVTNTVIQTGERAISKIVRDPTKPVGYRFFNNSPVDGAKVWVTVSIYDHRKLHWRKRYFSNYPAVDGVTVVGTRT
jgi:vancomycin resistance protein YoaR